MRSSIIKHIVNCISGIATSLGNIGNDRCELAEHSLERSCLRYRQPLSGMQPQEQQRMFGL